MDRRKFTKDVTKFISTGIVVSTGSFISACDDGEDVLPEGTLSLLIEEEPDLVVGENFAIKWNSNGIGKIDLAYKIDQAANYLTFQREYDASVGQFDFEVPENINGSTLTFRISDSASGNVLAEGSPLTLIFKWPITLSQTQALDNVGGFVKITEVNNPFIVRKTGADTFLALSLVCTHQGCVVGVEDNGALRCPCHGSTFTDAGAVTQGPAERPLSSFRIEKIDADNIVVYYS